MSDTTTIDVDLTSPKGAKLGLLLAQREAAVWEAEYNAAHARKVNAEAEITEAMARATSREEAERLAMDSENLTYVFNGEVHAASVSVCMKRLNIWVRKAAKPITVELVVNSPGGGIIEGFALIDFIESLRAKGHTINTHAIGMAASMGGVLLQAGTTRTMGSNAVMLVHEAQFTARGSYGSVQDEFELVKKLQGRILDLFARRAAEATTAVEPLGIEAIEDKWHRKDWWLTSEECVRYGFVDGVR